MARLLVIHHSPTANTQALAEAIIAGAGDELIENVAVTALSPVEVDAPTVNSADGVLILTPANFGYMAGLVKDMFDRTFLDIGGSLSADGGASPSKEGRKPFGLCVHGNYDAEGAVLSVQRIVTALPWRQAAPTLSVLGPVTEEHRAAAYELGASVAALLM